MQQICLYGYGRSIRMYIMQHNHMEYSYSYTIADVSKYFLHVWALSNAMASGLADLSVQLLVFTRRSAWYGPKSCREDRGAPNPFPRIVGDDAAYPGSDSQNEWFEELARRIKTSVTDPVTCYKAINMSRNNQELGLSRI